jgi:hypothetical protein
MAKIKKYAAGGPTSPESIVAEIDRKQNEEDRDLIPRAGRMLRDKINEDLTGGAYVGSRLNMPSNTRLGKMSAGDTALLNKSDASKNKEKVLRGLGLKAGGKVSSASKRADGCAIRGKTKGRMV